MKSCSLNRTPPIFFLQFPSVLIFVFFFSNLKHFFHRPHFITSSCAVLETGFKPGLFHFIFRITQTISLERNRNQIPMTVCARRSISGILGILELMSGPHLVVITAKSKVNKKIEQVFFMWIARSGLALLSTI